MMVIILSIRKLITSPPSLYSTRSLWKQECQPIFCAYLHRNVFIIPIIVDSVEFFVSYSSFPKLCCHFCLERIRAISSQLSFRYLFFLFYVLYIVAERASSRASELGEDVVFMLLFLCSNLVADGSKNSSAIAIEPSKPFACYATAISVFAVICVHLSKGVVQTASDECASSDISAISDCLSKHATRTSGAIPTFISVCVHLSEGEVRL